MGKLCAIAFIITIIAPLPAAAYTQKKRCRCMYAGCDAALLERYPGCESYNPMPCSK